MTFSLQADGVAQTFGNPRQAVAALESGVVLVDRSHWGRIRVAGEGRMNFLHSQSTNDFKRLSPGQGCDTVRAFFLHTHHTQQSCLAMRIISCLQHRNASWAHGCCVGLV